MTGVAGRRLDRLFETAIAPAVAACAMELVRLDPTVDWPVTERQLLDNLLLSDAAIFDISDQIPELLYLLGIRLALRPESTVLLARAGIPSSRISTLPPLLSYHCDERGEIASFSLRSLVGQLSRDIADVHAETSVIEAEYYHLLREYRGVDISRTKTDRFRTAVRYRLDLKNRLSQARALGGPDALRALRAIEDELTPAANLVDSAVLVDLFLSYRAEGAWEDVCRFFDILPLPIKRTVMIREQYAMALNRRRMRHPALEILKAIEVAQGPSSETCSLIGRVYKDLWQDCEASGDRGGATANLTASIDAYQRGFNADWRDAYPGVNLLTLLDIRGDPSSLAERSRLLPVVRFAAEQRVASGSPDYWDYATLLELAAIAENRQEAERFLKHVVDHVAEGWQSETTSNNLQLLQRYRLFRRQEVGWMDSIISHLRFGRRTLD